MDNRYDLAWLEPGGFRFALFRESGNWPQPVKISLGAAVVLVAIFGTAEVLHPSKIGWLGSLGIAAGVWLAFQVLLFVHVVAPANVFIHSTGITRNSRRGTAHVREFWPWEKIGTCHLGLRKIRGRDYPALWIIPPGTASGSLVGISRSVSEESIRRAIAKYDREVRGTLSAQSA